MIEKQLDTRCEERPAAHITEPDSAVVDIVPACVELFQSGIRRGVLRFEAMLSGADGAHRGDLTITARIDGARAVLLTKRLQFGSDKRRYAVIFELPEGATSPRFELTHTSAPVTVLNREIITAKATVAYATAREYRVTPTSFDPLWTQNGSKLSVTWLGDSYTATMPHGFQLEGVPFKRLELASELLFGEIERAVFGRSRKLLEVARAASFEEFELGEPSQVLLCYSAGEDSTAALELLPPDRTVAYYNERNYTEYVTPEGARITLNPSYERLALRNVPGLVRIPNDFETIGLSIGRRAGYQDNFGYAALAVILAGYVGCNVVAFGSVMEQIFMKSGYNFSDVVHFKGARLVAYRSLFRDAGLYFSVPTGALSEILTHRITKDNRHGYIAVPCPSTSDAGEPCGTCFKCFRKLRFEQGVGAPDPSPSAAKFIMARPMKSATSVVTAAQLAGETRFGLAEYSNTDVSFVNRYYQGGLKGLVPADILYDLESALTDREIQPMSLSDEYRLRTVALVFDADGFSLKHAFPGAQAERFAPFLTSIDHGL